MNTARAVPGCTTDPSDHGVYRVGEDGRTRAWARQLMLFLVCLSFTAPLLAFQMEGLDGSRQFLHDRTDKGQWTLVMIWSLDCVPCEQQKPMISEFHRSHVDGVGIVIGIATDGPGQRAEVQTRLGQQVPGFENLLAYPDVFDRQYRDETGQDFRVTPTYLLYQPDGHLVGVHAGPIEREALWNVIQSAP